VFLLGGYVINLVYGFEGSFKRLGEFTFACRLLAVVDYSPFARWPT
jgi:hypothetical protein